MASTSEDRRKTREKVKAHRERQRARGFKLKQFWVPDVGSPAFVAAAHRASLAVASSPRAADDAAFLEAIVDWEGMPPWEGGP